MSLLGSSSRAVLLALASVLAPVVALSAQTALPTPAALAARHDSLGAHAFASLGDLGDDRLQGGGRDRLAIVVD